MKADSPLPRHRQFQKTKILMVRLCLAKVSFISVMISFPVLILWKIFLMGCKAGWLSSFRGAREFKIRISYSHNISRHIKCIMSQDLILIAETLWLPDSHQKESVEVVEVFESNAFWRHPRRGILNMSTQEDALRQIQDTLERL